MTGEAQRLLDSMDGVAMILDANLSILQIGGPNWNRFLNENGASNTSPPTDSIAASIGQPITAFMNGATLQSTFAKLFHSILLGRREAIRFDHRCDAPDLRRNMRLAVTLLLSECGERRLLYQSIVLSTEARAPLPLFAGEIAGEQGSDILTLCSICAQVAWPVGAPSGEREWIEPMDYYRRGGSETVKISHGICESCYVRLTEDG